MGKFADELGAKFPDVEEPDWKAGTIAWYIERRIEDSLQPGARAIGVSHLISLRARQLDPIGALKAAGLKAQDLIDHCRMRKANGVQAATANQDITYLRGVVREFVESEALPQSALDAFKKAKRKLEKEQLIGKSRARTRRPQGDESALLLEYFRKQNEHHNTKIPMDIIVEFQMWSARRISETCRITRGDVNLEKRTCWVRDLKNPKGKGEHAEFPLLGRAWEIVDARLKVIPDDPKARLFPYRAATCSQRFTDAKNKLAKTVPTIKGLRLHDLRREAISRLFEQGYGVPEVAKVSLHKNPSLLLGTYTSIPPESLHDGPASKREAPRDSASR